MRFYHEPALSPELGGGILKKEPKIMLFPMKTLSVLVGLLLLPVSLLADGYPFDDYTQEVFVDTLRVRLSDQQQAEITKTGRVTFTAEQRAIVAATYPKVPENVRVIAATYNDNLEDDYVVNRVDFFWVAPAELAVTLGVRQVDGQWLFPTKAEVMAPPHLRISPAGKIYHEKAELTLKQALELIRTAPNLDGDAGGDRLVWVTLPPPYRVSVEESEQAADNQAVQKLMTTLQEHGQVHKVTVQKMW